MILIKVYTNPECPDTISAKDAAISLCSKNVSEEEVAQCSTPERVEKVSSEMTDTLTPGVLFEVLPTEFTIFVEPMYKVRIAMVVNKSALYSTICILDTGEGPSID